MENLEKPKNKDYDFKDSLLSQEKQLRLNKLRSIQSERNFSKEEKEEFFRLSREEDDRRKELSGGGKLREEEKVELKELRQKQIDGDWTEQDKKRLLELQIKE